VSTRQLLDIKDVQNLLNGVNSGFIGSSSTAIAFSVVHHYAFEQGIGRPTIERLVI